MSSYLAQETLKEAIERLRSSQAKPSLCDFLIIKRALVRGEGDEATLSSVDEHLKGATLDLTLALPDDYEGDATARDPYFNPFGSAAERRGGWRTAKYISNGPADTVTGPGWFGITEQIPDAKPRRVRLKAGYEAAIAPVLLRQDGEKPALLDAAAWYFRFDDLEARLGAEWSDDQMVEAFATEVGLTDGERTILFGQ